jgi:DNA-binding MarR family transcriptional regulator
VADLRRLYMDVVRLEIELWDAVDRRLREACDISMGAFGVMEVVARTPDCRVQDIAQQLSVTVGGISKAVDRIEALGHVERRSNPMDRRSSIVALTPSGTLLLARAGAVVDEELDLRLGAALPSASLEQFGAVVAALRSHGARIDAERAAPPESG